MKERVFPAEVSKEIVHLLTQTHTNTEFKNFHIYFLLKKIMYYVLGFGILSKLHWKNSKTNS